MKFMLVFFALALSACATPTRYEMKIDAAASRNTYGAKVYADDLTSKSELDKAFYLKYVNAALQMAGFKIANSPSEADLTVFMQYGIGSTEKIDSQPVYNWVPPKQYSFTSQTQNLGWSRSTTGTISESGIGHAEYAGSRTYSYTEFNRWVTFHCFEKQVGNAQPKEVWKTELTSSGSSSDFRLLFPAFMAANFRYMGRDLDRRAYGSVTEADRLQFKKNMDERKPSSADIPIPPGISLDE